MRSSIQTAANHGATTGGGVNYTDAAYQLDRKNRYSNDNIRPTIIDIIIIYDNDKEDASHSHTPPSHRSLNTTTTPTTISTTYYYPFYYLNYY